MTFESSVPKPLVTIAIPTYNRAPLLRLAIESALAQTYENIEVVVSDNASEDETQAMLKGVNDPRFRYVRQSSNLGLIGNWNACLALAKGEFFLMLSDDDCLLPNAIADLVGAISLVDSPSGVLSSEEIAFSYGQCEILRKEEGKIHGSRLAPLVESSLDYQVGVLNGKRVSYPSATLLRTRDGRSVGGYDSKYSASIDLGLVFEIAHRRPYVVFTGNTTTHYLMHSANFTSSLSLEKINTTIRLLSELTLSSVKSVQPSRLKSVKQATRYAMAHAIAYASIENYSAGKQTLSKTVDALWCFRANYKNPLGLFVLLKSGVKLAIKSCHKIITVSP